MSHLGLVTVLVHDYDEAISFFVEVLGFEVVNDVPSLTDNGRPKRWVEVKPPSAETGLLLAKADGPDQVAAVGRQFAGRVGLFLRVEDFVSTYQRMLASGVRFHGEPREEPYGEIVVFEDLTGNRWDLLGPAPVVE